MAPKAGIYPPIFRIDVDAAKAFFGSQVDIEGLPARIVASYNDNKNVLTYSREGEVKYDGSTISVYRNTTSRPKPSPWINFFQGAGISIPQAISQSQHFICFIALDDALYALTGGHSAVVFDRFVDVSFPIEVARRIAIPEIKRARSSPISGTALANDTNFRDPRRITYTESLENVWTAIGGEVRTDVLISPEVRSIFGLKESIRLEVGASIKLGPRIDNLDKLLKLIRWYSKVSDSPLPEEDDWAVLDSIKVLNPRKSRDLIKRLVDRLAEKIFVDHAYADLAILNADASKFANASIYTVTKGTDDLYHGSERPELASVAPLAQPGPAGPTPLLTEIFVRASSPDTSADLDTFDTLLAHLHGEMEYENHTYFLLAGRWYEVDAAYIDLVTKDLLGLVKTLDKSRESLGMRKWKSTEEEKEYNATSVKAELVINGDRVLTEGVELFDTLAFDGERIYLIHVKKGFDVNVRDVRSQVINSANVVENDLRGAQRTRLKRHYAALHRNKRTKIAESEFLDLFSHPRTYVLAYGTKEKVTPETLRKFRSRVARMEIVTMSSQFGQIASAGQDTRLALCWIEIED